MLQEIRDNRTYAHVVPLMVFMVVGMLSLLTGVIPWFQDHELLPWYRSEPSHWIYPLQTLASGICLAFFWRHYEFKNRKGLWLGVLMGVLGIGVWLLPTQLYTWLELTEDPESGPLKWFGVAARTDGFNPDIFTNPVAWWAVVVMRFLRAVVIVALVEEICWRGFLMRFVQNPDGNYWKIPFGRHHWKALVVVTLAFMLIHAPIDWPAAIIFGLVMYALAIYTKSLLACVTMHAVANLIMGIYALQTGKYGLW